MQAKTNTLELNDLEKLSDENLQFIEKLDHSFKHYLEVAKEKPPMKQLLGNYINKNELTILAGKTASGKTVAAYQTADAVTKGETTLNQKNESAPMKVIYLDFELKHHQIRKRYRNYEPNENFYRPDIKEILRLNDYTLDFDVIRSLINDIRDNDKEEIMLIVDNITAIAEKNTTNSDEALRILKELNKLIHEFEPITILVIAHTIKATDGKPLHLDQIGGHSNITNLIDNAFMIGKSKEGDEFKYLKQVKFRSNADEGEILLMQINEAPFLHFDFVRYDIEKNHINDIGEYDQSDHYRGKLEQVFDGKNGLNYTDFCYKYETLTNTSKDNAKKFHAKMKRLGLIIKDPIKNNWIISES